MRTEVGKVYSETAYSKFLFIKENRDVKEARKRKIQKSIEKIGWVRCPVVVNEKMEIVDGQGRFEACKQLGLPIEYVIAEGTGRDHCIQLNISSSSWTTDDYIRFYAEMGNESYARFLDTLMQFPVFTNADLFGIINGKIITSGWGSRQLKNGELVYTEERHNELFPIYTWVCEINDIIKKIVGSSRVIRTGLAWIAGYTECNITRLTEKLNDKWPVLNPVVDARPEVFLEDISNLYNKGLRPESCIDFDAEYKKYLRTH